MCGAGGGGGGNWSDSSKIYENQQFFIVYNSNLCLVIAIGLIVAPATQMCRPLQNGQTSPQEPVSRIVAGYANLPQLFWLAI